MTFKIIGEEFDCVGLIENVNDIEHAFRVLDTRLKLHNSKLDIKDFKLVETEEKVPILHLWIHPDYLFG